MLSSISSREVITLPVTAIVGGKSFSENNVDLSGTCTRVHSVGKSAKPSSPIEIQTDWGENIIPFKKKY